MAEQGGRPCKKQRNCCFSVFHFGKSFCIKVTRKGKLVAFHSKQYGMQRIQSRTGEEAEQKARIAVVRLDSLFK